MVRYNDMVNNKENKRFRYGYPVTVAIKAPAPLRSGGSRNQTDHRLPFGIGLRERRTPLPVYGTIHFTGPRNSRPPSIPSHPDILDKTETVEILLVIDRASVLNVTRDAAMNASIYNRRDVGGRQAGRDEAPPGGAAPRTPPVATEEEGGQLPSAYNAIIGRPTLNRLKAVF
ncbi:hypothetical protein BHM03_00008356 [Ensete ventricosum]|nr:hypothetical protein BHM03_00008356 [Ensete ventricosum]